MSAATSQLYTLREMVPKDESFVVYSWLKNFALSDEGRRMGANTKCSKGEDVMWRSHKPIVERILARGAMVRVAERPSDDLILGWSCIEQDPAATVVHYFLVRWEVRHQLATLRRPLVSDLLGDLLDRPAIYTHQMPDLQGVPDKWQYDPYRR